MSDPKRQSWLDWVPLACFFLALAAVVIVLVRDASSSPLDRLTIVVGYVILILLFFFGFMVLFAIARGNIDLSMLLSEAGGGASMSRFQLLLFTIVIAFSLFLIILTSKKLPDIPAGILTLLGISASTYAVSKGIQASNPDMSKPGTKKTVTVEEKRAPGEAKSEVNVTDAPASKDEGSKE
ncbi:MAG TPA: hypothetical protein VGS07_26010 [Thermoanaerobaculia bacterium]|jgi:hypothetical protein|nr:hypothetical protein [Thermoanaerobaculia bacterium]